MAPKEEYILVYLCPLGLKCFVFVFSTFKKILFSLVLTCVDNHVQCFLSSGLQVVIVCLI